MHIVLPAQKADTVTQTIDAIELRFDSLNVKLPQLPDSLLTPYKKIDSIRMSFNNKADSLQQSYDKTIAKLDHAETKINRTIDSLTRLKLPATKYRQKLDSIALLRTKAGHTFSGGLSDLQSKTTGKLNSLDLPDQYKEPVQQLTSKINAVSNMKPGAGVIPKIGIPGYSLPKMDELSELTSKAKELSNITNVAGNLPKIETPVEDLKSLATGNINEAKQLPKALEQRAVKEAGISDLQKQIGGVEEMKGSVKQLTEKEALQQKATSMAKKVSTDHFAGQEKQLQAAMDKVNKYKEKYTSVESLNDLPKRVPNSMKGKPLKERLVPGLYFQYQVKQFRLFDINPYLGYRITGRLTSGIGWNHRHAYDKATHNWNYDARVFGPRIYTDFNLKKSFVAHGEIEWMNTFVPTTPGLGNDTRSRQGIWSFMVGMKKEYKIYKNLKGTVLLQYNLYNPLHKAPYADRLNSRIGFEYVLKEKK